MSFRTTISGVPVELLDISQLIQLNSVTNQVDGWLLDTFFPNRASFAQKHVLLGDIKTDTPIAPYVAPCVEGRILANEGQANVTSVEPAYLKPKETITPCTAYSSRTFNMLKNAGLISSSNGKMSDAESLMVDQVTKFQRLRESVDNRVRLMAAEVITTGKTVMRSDDFPETMIDFGRSPDAAYAPAVPWSNPAATVVDEIQLMADRHVDLIGQGSSSALTSTKLFNSMLKNPQFSEAFIKPLAGISVPYTQTIAANHQLPQFRGYLPATQIAIWTYDATYDRGSVKTRLIPEDFFGLIGGGPGTLAQCGIQNLKAYMQPLQYFDYMWYNDDPSALFMTCESSPLVIPGNKNMTVGGRGFLA